MVLEARGRMCVAQAAKQLGQAVYGTHSLVRAIRALSLLLRLLLLHLLFPNPWSSVLDSR